MTIQKVYSISFKEIIVNTITVPVVGLEVFINKIAGHPLAQNERCLHMFLQEPTIDKNYVPGKIRNT